ncbi:extracellular solute-binding protein [Paenibacillus sp. J5C_2022]|uniref:extracellular solute-binding protein n=1 Tax=Paenibacillus sp. J5C2022 TaxID=2977129 RepID=UPI0021CEE8DD|nr:extracellular solute-binding protein [Paenibacillus sp. J5C2022]MCU6711275.1 extracellular solute-binding protein [Paenibacillus sp. J5C2022]
MNKWLKVTLVFLLAFSVLAACSKENNAKSEDEPTKSPASTGNESGTEGDEKDKLAFPLAETAELDILAFKASSSKVNDYNEYELYKNLEKETNVHINWTLVDEMSKMEKLNLIFSSGEYPDAIYGSMVGGIDLSNWANQGLLLPLNELIEKHAPNLKKLFEEYPEYKKAITHADGNIYALPKAVDAPFYRAPDTMWINKKWLDAVGRAVPTTTDELYEALKAFQGKDLNGNGKKDEIPMSFMFNSNWIGGNSLASSFGIMDHQWNHSYIKDGKVLFAPQQEGYKDYVRYMNKLYSEGLLDQEMITQTSAIYHAKLQNEVPILGVASYPIASTLTNGDEYVPLLGLKGPNGDIGWKQENPGIWSGAFMMTSSNKNPEITMKWVDTHYDFEMSLEIQEGPVGIGLKKLADGTYEDMPTPDGMDNMTFNFSLAPGFNAPNIIPSKNYSDGIFITPREKEELAAYKLKEPLLTLQGLNTLLIYEADDYEALSVFEDMNGPNGYVNSSFADFLMKGLTDEKWEKHLEQLKKLGVDTFLEIHSKYQLK